MIDRNYEGITASVSSASLFSESIQQMLNSSNRYLKAWLNENCLEDLATMPSLLLVTKQHKYIVKPNA